MRKIKGNKLIDRKNILAIIKTKNTVASRLCKSTELREWEEL